MEESSFLGAEGPKTHPRHLVLGSFLKSLLMPLFLMGCFPVDFQEAKRPLRTESVKRPIKAGKRPMNEGKRPIKAKVLVGVSVGSLMGCFRAAPPWGKTAPLKRPIKRSMSFGHFSGLVSCFSGLVLVGPEPSLMNTSLSLGVRGGGEEVMGLCCNLKDCCKNPWGSGSSWQTRRKLDASMRLASSGALKRCASSPTHRSRHSEMVVCL